MTEHRQITAIKRRYLWIMGTEVLLWSSASALLVYFVIKTSADHFWLASTSAFVASLGIAIFKIRKSRLTNMNELKIAAYLNRTYPQLQNSADLLLRSDHTLNALQLLQKRKTNQQLEEIFPSVKLPNQIAKASLFLALCAIISFGLVSFQKKQQLNSQSSTSTKISEIKSSPLPTTVREVQAKISPPAYTKIANKEINTLDLQLPEGSSVQWRIKFNAEVFHPALVFPENDTLRLNSRNGFYTTSRSFNSSTFYQLIWRNTDSTASHSTFYKVQVTNDRPPEISVKNLNQFQEFKITDKLAVQVNARITDDYGIANTEIIATVSKGSGEAVKFREEKLSLNTNRISQKQLDATRSIDLEKLGLEPGDELYFYIQAYDNKTPIANRSRTETYFVTIEDTTAMMSAGDMGLGVDVLPEYFRSQRQIIIDTEKLLIEKKSISREIFNTRSNNLAHDQKLLRLRYGEFLGEEFESNIGPHSAAEPSDDEGDIVEKFGHAHDGNNEHNLVEEQHAHGTEDQSSKNSNSLSDLVHSHDNEDEATFFTQSIKAKLKAAITIMWDAELHLRLYEPQRSLPYQYRALQLLKEISQQSRIYVHRTGFDPPPLKEDKRLTGDLAEIPSGTDARDAIRRDEYKSVRDAIAVIEKLQHDSIPFSPGDKLILTEAGRMLAKIELNQPGTYLKSLSLLQTFLQDELPKEGRFKSLRQIHQSLLQILPEEMKSPRRAKATLHALDMKLVQKMETAKSGKQ